MFDNRVGCADTSKLEGTVERSCTDGSIDGWTDTEGKSGKMQEGLVEDFQTNAGMAFFLCSFTGLAQTDEASQSLESGVVYPTPKTTSTVTGEKTKAQRTGGTVTGWMGWCQTH